MKFLSVERIWNLACWIIVHDGYAPLRIVPNGQCGYHATSDNLRRWTTVHQRCMFVPMIIKFKILFKRLDPTY